MTQTERQEAMFPASLLPVAARVEERIRGLLDAELIRWRAVDPAFNPAAVMPAVLQLIRALLNPVTAPAPGNDNQTTQ